MKVLRFGSFRADKKPMRDFDSPKIWFIRHAESEANLQRIYANEGCLFPLTVNGLQAHPIDHLCIVKGELKGGRLICVEYDGNRVFS